MARALTWALVLVTLAITAALGQLSLEQATARPSAGIRTEHSAGSVVVTYVLPAGLGWGAGIRPGNRILLADGRPAEGLQPAEVDTAKSLTFASRSGEVMTVPIQGELPDTPAKQAAFLFIAASFVAIGAVVVILIDDL